MRVHRTGSRPAGAKNFTFDEAERRHQSAANNLMQSNKGDTR